MKSYFFDTYAFYEIIEGNKNYEPYAKDVVIITTKLNLMELHYGLLLKHGKKAADRYYDSLCLFAVEISDDIIKSANELRAMPKKRDLSCVDCIGYTIAGMRGIKFLTGDRQFRDLENVEFVK